MQIPSSRRQQGQNMYEKITLFKSTHRYGQKFHIKPKFCRANRLYMVIRIQHIKSLRSRAFSCWFACSSTSQIFTKTITLRSLLESVVYAGIQWKCCVVFYSCSHFEWFLNTDFLMTLMMMLWLADVLKVSRFSSHTLSNNHIAARTGFIWFISLAWRPYLKTMLFIFCLSSSSHYNFGLNW